MNECDAVMEERQAKALERLADAIGAPEPVKEKEARKE